MLKINRRKLYAMVVLVIAPFATGFGQDSGSVLNKIISFPAKTQAVIDKKITNIDVSFERTIEKQLKKIQKQEDKIYRKFRRKDTAAANNYLLQSKESLATLKDKLANPGNYAQYIPSLDTVKTSMQFLNQQGELANQTKEARQKLETSLKNIAGLENQLNKAEELKKSMQQRKEYLKEQLSKFGLVKELKIINKQVYYYTAQIKEYKEILNDPKKIEKKAIELLSKTKLFQDFMAKNSLLAGLFPSAVGGATADPAAFLAANPTLQTRAMLNNIIQHQIAAGGPNAQASFQQNLQDAQTQITQLKDKVLKAGMGNSDDELPQGFKPNNQKTKALLKRLEYGANIQTQKATSYFPVTSDIGLSVGYKLNETSVIGVGASFKMGWGRNWNDIKITGQGVSLRSFIDWKIKGNFYLSGGYEQNYRNAITGLNQLQNLSAWQQSGLLGVSKKINGKGKIFKGSKIQLLYDFLSKQHIPASQAIIFRIGYSIK